MTTKTLPVLSFAKLQTGMPMPHLLDIQTRAFQSLLQPDGKGTERSDVGLERVFKDLFPIQDVNGNYSLEFVKYGLGEAKYTVEECIERDMTYSVPLKATLQLVVMEEVGETVKTKRPKNIIEKEVYLGELPILTPLGTFVINGAERVIVSQLHRSPGVVFEESIHPNGQRLFSARIIPFRGSWVEFTIDIHDVIYVHIDKKKKFPATALLRAFGYGTNAEILKLFYATKDIDITGKLEGRAQKREVLGTLLAAEVPDPENKKGEPLSRVGDELTLERFNAFRRAGITGVKVFAGYTALDLREDAQPTTTQQQQQGKYVLAFDVADPETGEVIADAGREISDTLKKKMLKAGLTKVDVLLPAGRSESPLIKNTLIKDPTHTEAEALEQIYTLLRPGEAPNLETAREALKRLFFHPKRYDLGRVGRYKINQRLKVNEAKDNTVLTENDFIAIIRYLIELSEGRGYTDDIDHLGNRRVRSVGELIANQFSVGLSRMARLIKERMSINNDPERITLDDLVNARTVSAVIQAFFGSSQLSQFMDQTNPLAELTHKRRLSALGPGGLTRERAGFEVRDVHYSQYGRMCPIETPEGPNIGLITSLSCYARVNDLGFIETPYRIVKDGKVTDDIRWLSASEEEEYAVAQANAKLTPEGRFADELVLCRKRDDYPLLPAHKIDFMDVAPEQLVSIAAALIPFLEHDDANRALMGSNMQRQSVPLLFPQKPLVGTGLEDKVARDSGAVVIARRGGVVTRVTADEIIIDAGDEDTKPGDHPLARLKQHDRFRLKKFWRKRSCWRRAPAPRAPCRRRRRGHGARGAGARRQRHRGFHALVRPQLRGRHRPVGAPGEGRRVLVDPHPGARAPRAGYEAGAGRDHARDPERRRGVSRRSGRAGHRAHRRPRQGGRHPGRQDHAEGRDGVVPRREAAHRDLRGEGEGREGLVAQSAAGHGGRGHRRQDLLAHRGPGGGEGPRRADRRGTPARSGRKGTDLGGDVHRAGGAPGQSGRGPDAQGGDGGGVPRGGHQAHAAAARLSESRRRRPQDAARREQDRERADPGGARRGDGGARQDRGKVGGPDRQDPPAGRAPAGGDPAGEGLLGREAQDLGGRQDGGTPRQ